MGENSRTHKDVLVNCKQISGLIRQQHSNHRYSASVILDDLKEIHTFLLKEASTSFGCNYDEGGNSSLGERYNRVAYGILPDLVSHVLKMDPQTDGDFEKMYKMVIDIFCCITAVCPVELMPFLFSTFASLLLYFSEKKSSSSVSKLQSIVMYKLCYYMFPLCLAHPRSAGTCYSMVPAVISSVLDTCREEDMRWCMQIMDILMSLKKDICLDVITVISSGTKRVRKQAEKILIHYWLRPQEKQNGEEILKAWELVKCSWCSRAGNLVCINSACTIHLHDRTSEYKYLHFCTSCHTSLGASCENVFLIAKPIGIEDRLTGSCQLGNCHGTAALACFHPDCISLAKISQSFVRMCSECAASRHDSSDCDHIFQDGLQSPWTCQNEITRIALLGALSKLLEDILVAYQNNSKEAHSMDYDSTAAVIMLDQYCQCPACELDDDMHNWMVHLVSLVLNWLYEIYIIEWQQSSVVGKIIIPWLVRALQQEVTYVAESVLPNLPSYAQVGRLWNSTHSIVECRKHTLEIIKMLQDKILVDGRADLFYQIFDHIIPHWLKELSSSPDQLLELKDYFKQLFETSGDNKERKKKFNFINATLCKKEVHEAKEALCWLQALTRMDIEIPFLKETIQLSIHKPILSKISSFDIKASAKHIPAAPYGRKSSWSDSEFSDASSVSGLVTRSSVEYTGDILDVDSTLTRYIIMLDVWLSQIKLVEDFSTLQFSDIQGIVLTMLKDSQNWGSFHNHNCPSEICLLCYAIVLWFNLANLTFEKYTPPAPVLSVYGEDEQLQPTQRPSRASYFYKFFPLRRMTPMQEHYPIDARTSVESSGAGSVVEQSSQVVPTSPVREKSSSRRERKIARIDTHTNYTLVSESLQENPNKHAKKLEAGKLYKIFQECLKLWRPASFIPEASYQIILFITTLFRNKLLNEKSFYSTYIADVDRLIINLWNSLICEYTYLSKAAVSLLYECLELLTFPAILPANEDLQEVKFRSMVDSKFEQDSYARRFEVVEKAFLMVQFTENVKKLSCQTQLSLSCVFCHLVGSLQDSSSHVTTRAKYCLQSLKKSAFVAVQDAMILAFNNYPNHRSSILMTISLLNSHLNLMFTSPLKFFVGLEPYLKLLKECHTDQRKRKKGKGLEEKLSIASHSVQIMNEYLNSDQSNAAILQQILSLLMQVLAHPDFKATLLDEVAIEIAISSPAGQEKEKLSGLTVIMDFFRLIVCQHFVPLPEKLRESHFFETYLRNIYQVLDVNTTFGNSPEVLLFNLRLLIFSACPTYNDYQSLSERIKQTNISLVLLDSTLCLAWLKSFFVICYKYVLQILQSAEKEKLQDYVVACVMITLNTLQRTAHYCIPTPRQKLYSNSIQEQGLFMGAVPLRNPSVTSNDSGSSSLTMTSSRQGDGQKCPLCNAVIGNTLNEEIITQCVVTLSTALHHMPVLTSHHLIEGINALAMVALPDRFSWDNTNKARDQAPNSASIVSKQYLKCLLTQHGDRKLFLYLFKYCDRKELMEAIFISLPPPLPVEQDNSASLNEGEENAKKADKPILDQISPVKYFLEDLQEEPSILRKSNVIINLSNYLHLIRDANGKKILYSLIPQFEFFFEKLKHLPKANDIEKAYSALLKIMILLNGVLKEDPPKHGLISRSLVVQQFAFYHCAILSMGFKYTLVPLHGLVALCSSWYHSLESHSLSYTSLDSIITTLNYELVQVLKLKSPRVNLNALTLLKFFMLCFHGNIGFVDDIFNEAKTIFCRDLNEDQFFNHVVNAFPQTTLQTTLQECLGFLCSRLSSVRELKLHVAKLLVTNLCSGTPSKAIFQRLQQIDATLKASPTEDRTLQSVLKTSAGYLIVLGWMMVAAMKLTVMRQIFIQQISDAGQEREVDDPSSFLYQILGQQPLVNINTTVNFVLDLIIKNCNAPGVDKDIIKNLFLFLEIWTVYLEVVLPKGEDNTLIVIGVWRNVIQQIHRIPMIVETTVSIVHHLNKAVAHIKRANLFLTTKIIPFWRETLTMGELAQYCTELWKEVGDAEIASETSLIAGNETMEHPQKQTGCCSEHGLDPWYSSAIQRLTDMDVDYRTDI